MNKNMVTSLPACGCKAIIDEENRTINVIKLCQYHQTVSKCGLGRVFVAS